MFSSVLPVITVAVLIVVVLYITSKRHHEHFAYPFDANNYEYIPKTNMSPIPSESITPLDPTAERGFIQVENKRCQYVQTSKADEETIDLLKNYRLLNHPTKRDACYLKMSDTLVDKTCSKYNTRLYNDAFKDVIDSIGEEEYNDAYVAQTLQDKLCTFNFKPSPLEDRTKYAQFLDENDPKTAGLIQELKKVTTIKEKVQHELVNLHSEIDANNASIYKLHTTIKEQEIEKNNKSKHINELNTDVNALTEEDKNFDFSAVDDNKTKGVLSLQTSKCNDYFTPWQNTDFWKLHGLWYRPLWTTPQLSKHVVFCGKDKYLSRLRLEAEHSPDKHRYAFTCCDINKNVKGVNVNHVVKANPPTNMGDGNHLLMDKQNVDCGQNMLAGAWLTGNVNKKYIQYAFWCNEPKIPEELRPRTICTDNETKANEEGNGIHFLNRHSLFCPNGQSLSQMQLVREPDKGLMKYKYKCCQTLVNQK